MDSCGVELINSPAADCQQTDRFGELESSQPTPILQRTGGAVGSCEQDACRLLTTRSRRHCSAI